MDNMFYYEVSENKIKVFTSKLFNSIEEAVKSFLTEDAPIHYAKDHFTASVIGSYMHNELPAEKRRVKTPGVDGRTFRPRVYVYFYEVNPTVISRTKWANVINKNS